MTSSNNITPSDYIKLLDKWGYGLMNEVNKDIENRVLELERKMEKLIKLLNEYGDINWNKAMIEHQDTYIISKKFGFIKWLVENDKIVDNNAFREYKAYGEGENYYFYLISELAVSDNPIQDLISLLK